MKFEELTRKLHRLGWRRIHQGGRHEVWGKDTRRLAVPRHAEINEWTAKSILKEARGE